MCTVGSFQDRACCCAAGGGFFSSLGQADDSKEPSHLQLLVVFLTCVGGELGKYCFGGKFGFWFVSKSATLA